MPSYVVYADEAWTHNPDLRFWRFYGAAMLRADDRERITNDLLELKAHLGLHGELAWTDVRPFNWERVRAVVERFLQHVDSGDIKLRYMWLDQLFQNPDELTLYHQDYGYYILYYFFVVFGFGLPWHDCNDEITIEFFPDTLPDEPAKRADFRRFLMNCHLNRRFTGKSKFRFTNVGDVDSRNHIILQCVDVIIGAMGFRLNRLNLRKQSNGRRAKGTIAKACLYGAIQKMIASVDMRERGTHSWGPGINTATAGDLANRWRYKFRQWDFRRPGAFNPDWARR